MSHYMDASTVWLGGAVVLCLLVILATGTDLAIGAVHARVKREKNAA